MKRLITAALLLPLSFTAAADVYTMSGSGGQPASENEPTHSYQCFNDGNRLFANTGAGYGRCRAVFPLTVPDIAGVLWLRAFHSSQDKSSHIKVTVYKSFAGSTEFVAQGSDDSSSQSVNEMLEMAIAELVSPGQSLYAVVEVRGDTKIETVQFEFE